MEKDRFEAAHRQWRDGHLAGRSGERRRRLEEGHAHAEKEMLKHVWWPAFGSLEHLHPEYEVTDFREGKRYIDLAYVRAPFKIAFEIDGFGPHVRDLSRRQFADQWVRHMHLINDGWIVVRIGYDDVKERPRLWQQLIAQLIGRLYGERSSAESDAAAGGRRGQGNPAPGGRIGQIPQASRRTEAARRRVSGGKDNLVAA